MTKISVRQRAISAVTLLSFTLTTISPSLAWAAEREEAAPAAAHVASAAPAGRVLDAVPAKALEAGSSKAEVASEAKPDVSFQKPDKDELENAVGAKADAKPAVDAQVQSNDAEALALPTGGDKSGVTSQAISVPKGSGTIQGMGESFSAQLSTGIATFSVPFGLLVARGAAQPSLSLSYSSASGAGLAGMGWSVGVPYIARQTDRGLPEYDDRADWHANQDRFVFNGGQELVPICTVGAGLECSGVVADEVMPSWGAGYQYFRPRVEGSFLRFFWSPNHKTWRIEDKSGLTMELGAPLDGSEAHALEVSPDDEAKIFRWHLARQYDTYGTDLATTHPKPVNVVVYRYFQDAGQAYLSDIYDTTPKAAASDTQTLGAFAHHTHLSYEPRTDPSETYNSGWLIRQTKRLSGVDVTSKTDSGLTEARRQVRRYRLEYDGGFHTSYLTSVQVEGRCGGSEHDDSVPVETNELLGDSNCPKLPPMTFGYSHVRGFNTAGTAIESGLAGYEAFDARIQQVGSDPPHSIDEELTDYFDVNADGLPDVLVTAPGVYGNDYGVFFNSAGGIRNTFGAVEQLNVAGVLGASSGSIKLSNPNVSSLDFDGDGIVDFLHMPKVKTYAAYRFTPPGAASAKWRLVGSVVDAANKQSPKIDLGKDAAETRVADVNFDGMVDLVVSTGTQFQTFLSLGRLPGGDAQFGNGRWASKATSTLSNDPVAMCVPYSGTPVRFSDADIQLADMNGDGIQDIVRLRRGDVRYWPGRGNGFWGTGRLDDCPAGTFGDKRYVATDNAPYYSDIQGTSLRMDDVNGDGLDDLVQVRADAVDVWLNVDGKGWTQRYVIDGTTASPSYADRVRLMDINGSGTRDIVWGNGKQYEFLDLDGGERPGLLISIKNGLGKSMDLEYGTSTEEMLAAERLGAKCEGAEGTFDNKWCSKMPTVTHLVKRVTESDNLSVAGAGKSQYITEYSYRDPFYEGRQREFRGFRKVRSKRVGDANSPTDLTESTFLLGECEDETDDSVDDCALSERWRDNPKEALKGLPVVAERFDEEGVRLSTSLTFYTLRHLYSGLDGRAVRHVFQNATKSYNYDTALGVVAPQADSFDAVQVEAPPSLGLSPTSKIINYSHYSNGGTAIVEGAAVIDEFGNQTTVIAKGCTGGGACPTPDEVISKYTLPTRIGDWMFRTGRRYVKGSVQTDVRGDVTTTYDAFGAPKSIDAVLTGAGEVDRFNEIPGWGKAVLPATAAVNGPRHLGDNEYDGFGNLTKQMGPPGLGRCRKISYDIGAYSQLPMGETIFTAGCDNGGLMTSASYDRGLGVVVIVTDPNERLTTVSYDGFGRLTSLFRPRLTALSQGQIALPSVKIDYSLPSAADPRAYSLIHTQAQDGANENDDKYLESYSFVDGMGRARVGVSEADHDEDGAYWIVSSIAEFDAKGAVRRKYLPFFFPGQHLSGLPIGDENPATQYGRQRYDAFGRQVQTFDVDGTVTLQSRYHALSTDLWDAADLSPGPHQGSYASTRKDGHGRTVETIERVHDGGTLDLRYLRMQYLPTGEPTTISRVRGSSSVVRWMRYDSLGRMVLNVDPHTSVNFTADLTATAPVPSTSTSLRAWRYAYNDVGDLVGTSDARGCGQNFHYDGAGRLYGEDYSPCLKEHGVYTAPVLGTTPYDVATLTATAWNAFEVFYQFDSAPTLPVAPPVETDGYTAASRQNLKGKIVAVHDRAASTWFSYDILGRSVRTFRKVSYIGAPRTTLAGRYVDHWYHQDFTYDAAGRIAEQTTGVASAQLKSTDVDRPSSVMTHYTNRGSLRNVDSSYGELVKDIKRSADGLVQSVTLGDAAETQTAMRYDSRRRLASVQTFRRHANLWSTTPSAISPVPTEGDSERTHQLLLQDLDYSYDIVSNPTEIRDWRTPEEWPDGAKPVTRRMEYDDLYRLTRIDYEYPGGFDKFVSPYAPELNGQTDPRRAQPRGHKLLSKRALWQKYKYDWLGNTTQTDDDQHVFWDRSLGTVGNDTAGGKPYQLSGASQAISGGLQNGSLVGAPSYDATGNLTYAKVAQSQTACATSLSVCYSRFWYTWDEVGRLTNARRVEGEGPNAIGPFLDYLYDANDERIVKQHYFNELGGANTPKVTTLYVFDTLEVRRAPFDTVAKQYLVDSSNEVGYLSANGVRLARLHYEPPTKGEPKLVTSDAKHSSDLHIFLNLPDQLGSSSMIIDHATGELVEARTYQPYGATESDYRPERWKGFREDYGFTGKEEDIEVGVQYFGKRYLSPYLGRWLSADPLAVHQPGQADLNLYAYVHGQVLRNVDPVGLDRATLKAEYQAQRAKLTKAIDQTAAAASKAEDAGIAAEDDDESARYFEQADKLNASADTLRKTRQDLDNKYEWVVLVAFGPVLGPRDVKDVRESYAAYSRTFDAVQAAGAMVIPLVGYWLYKEAKGEKRTLDQMEGDAQIAAAANAVVEVGAATAGIVKSKRDIANMPAVDTIKPTGRGSTADGVNRWLPRDLREQLAVEEAMQNPLAGRSAGGPTGDPRWPGSKGWVKMQQDIVPSGKAKGGPVSVHYNYNTETGEVDDFKVIYRNHVGPGVDPTVPSKPPEE